MVRGATEVRGRGRSQGRQQRGLRGRGEGAGPGGQRQGGSRDNRSQSDNITLHNIHPRNVGLNVSLSLSVKLIFCPWCH